MILNLFEKLWETIFYFWLGNCINSNKNINPRFETTESYLCFVWQDEKLSESTFLSFSLLFFLKICLQIERKKWYETNFFFFLYFFLFVFLSLFFLLFYFIFFFFNTKSIKIRKRRQRNLNNQIKFSLFSQFFFLFFFFPFHFLVLFLFFPFFPFISLLLLQRMSF